MKVNELVKLLMVGECQCKNPAVQVVSRYPFEFGVCPQCGAEVPLQLAILPAPKIQKALMQVSEASGVPVEELAEALLKKMAEAVKRGFMIKYKL